MKSIYLLYGEERFLIRRELEQIKKLNPGAAVEILSEIPAAELAEKIFLPSLFSPSRILIINDFDFSDEAGALEKALACIPPSLTLVFVYPKNLDGRTRIYKAIEDQACEIECRRIPEWEEEKLIDWVMACAKDFGKSIDRRCAELLIEFAGNNLDLLYSEIEKLSIYLKDGSEIKEEDIEVLVPKTGYDSFTLSDALLKRDKRAAFDSLNRLLGDKEEPVEIMGLISSQFRNLFKVKLLLKRKLNNYQAAKQIGANPYHIKKIMAEAHRFTEDELAGALEALCQTDIRIKSGFNPKVELALLLSELLGEKR